MNVMREKLHTKTIKGRTGETKTPSIRKLHAEACHTHTPTPASSTELQPAPVQARMSVDKSPNVNASRDSSPGLHLGRERKSLFRMLSTTVAWTSTPGKTGSRGVDFN